MFKFNNKNWRRSSVLIVNFEHISQIFLVFLLLNLKKVNVSWGRKKLLKKEDTLVSYLLLRLKFSLVSIFATRIKLGYFTATYFRECRFLHDIVDIDFRKYTWVKRPLGIFFTTEKDTQQYSAISAFQKLRLSKFSSNN